MSMTMAIERVSRGTEYVRRIVWALICVVKQGWAGVLEACANVMVWSGSGSCERQRRRTADVNGDGRRGCARQRITV